MEDLTQWPGRSKYNLEQRGRVEWSDGSYLQLPSTLERQGSANLGWAGEGQGPKMALLVIFRHPFTGTSIYTRYLVYIPGLAPVTQGILHSNLVSDWIGCLRNFDTAKSAH
jgi:hypothetical protein